jgi:hypothetical protein
MAWEYLLHLLKGTLEQTEQESRLDNEVVQTDIIIMHAQNCNCSTIPLSQVRVRLLHNDAQIVCPFLSSWFHFGPICMSPANQEIHNSGIASPTI